MAILRLVSIKCIEMNDLIGNDDVFIVLDGQLFQTPIKMLPGDVLNFGPRRAQQFEGTITLELWEKDPNDNDFIGSVQIKVTQASPGPQTVLLQAADRGKYELTYLVTAE